MTDTNKALRTIEGRVVSNKMQKTVTVVIERLQSHTLYGKALRRTTKVHAHDESGKCQEGDKVTVEASISRAVVRQYGVNEAAVAPFLHGVNSLILPWIEELAQEASAVFETTDSQ